MDMDESTLVIMKMDAICREHSLGDITASDLFHIGRRRKIPLFAIDIYSEIRMMVSNEWPRGNYIGRRDTEYYEYYRYDIFFQFVVVLIIR